MIACLLIVFSALIQWILTLWFAGRMRKRVRPEPLPETQQQATWVLMSVRGADPTLGDAMKSLLSQDFREYRLCVVVDDEHDPAVGVIRESIGGEHDPDRVEICVLRDPSFDCTLKCSAIAAGVEHVFAIDEDVEYFVFVDADSQPPTSMMKTLTGALFADPRLGLASGNQWFEPAAPASVGSIVRSLWYAGALFFSMLFHNPWAGAYAMRACDLRRIGLIDAWRRSAVDDGVQKKLLARYGLVCRVLPSMVVVNQESCTLSYVLAWMRRILTWSRIHEPGFWLTALQMSFSSALIVAIFSTLIRATVMGDWGLVGITLASMLVSGGLSVLAWRAIRSSVAAQADSAYRLKNPGWRRMLGALLLISVAHVIYTLACLGAVFCKRIRWRGVEYEVFKDGVRLIEYVPYSGSASEKHSI